MTYSLGKYFGSHHLSERFSHILISQAIYQGVLHGNHYGVEHSSHLINIQAIIRIGLVINKKDCSIKDTDGCEMGGTGEECSVPSLCRVHPQYSDENKQVGGQDDHESQDLIEIDYNEQQHLTDCEIRARKT
jgi:hypothetical protein